MAGIDNLNASELEMRLRKLEKALRVSRLNNASIGRGGLTVRNGGVVRIINDGGLVVEGTADITGTLQVTGTLNADGTITLSGPVTISGVTAITGDTTVSGDLAVEGATTLKSDLTVVDAGRIVVGEMIFDPDAGPSGSSAIISSTAITVDAISLTAKYAIFAGDDITANGRLIAGGLDSISGVSPNLYIDENGVIYRII